MIQYEHKFIYKNKSNKNNCNKCNQMKKTIKNTMAGTITVTAPAKINMPMAVMGAMLLSPAFAIAKSSIRYTINMSTAAITHADAIIFVFFVFIFSLFSHFSILLCGQILSLSFSPNAAAC